MAALVLSCVPARAEKITADPNAPSAQVAAKASAQEEIDPRLLQKITYTSGYKRLHSVVDDLGKATGVTIYSGQSPKNWQVRDIPMVVCVKDLPLGKLLRALADTAHLRLSWHNLTKDGKETWSYRLSRSIKEEIEIDSLFDKQHESDLAVAEWAWDAMRTVGKSPERDDIDKTTRLMARLIASLGDDSKQRLLAYDTFTCSGKDLPNSAIVHDLYRIGQSEGNALDEGEVADPVTEADMERASLGIKLIDKGAVGGAHVEYAIAPMVWRNTGVGWTKTGSWDGKLTDLAAKLRDVKDLDIPPYPDEAKPPSEADDINNPDMTLLSGKNEWNRPALNEKFDLEKPKDRTPVFSELTEALVKATRFNVVCEDFTSHREDNAQYQVPLQYHKGLTLREALQTGGMYNRWFINDENRLLIGWAWRNWRGLHRNLLPEAYLLALHRKLNNGGVDIDDAASFASLSDGQFGWISGSRSLRALGLGRPSEVALWKLYDSLKPEDKALAKSEAGLSLAKFDPARVRDAFMTQRMAQGTGLMVGEVDEEWERKRREEAQQKERALSDPDVISTMVMRLQKRPAGAWGVRTKDSDGKAGVTVIDASVLKLSEYSLVIDYEQDGEKRKLTIPGPGLAFPVRSPEREAEILKAATDKKK